MIIIISADYYISLWKLSQHIQTEYLLA